MRINTAVWLGNLGIFRKIGLSMLVLAAAFAHPLTGLAASPPSVTLTPSVTSPQKLGTPVTWTATVQNAAAGHTYGYQFSVTYSGQTQIVSDFSPTPTFTWVPHTVEGAYAFNVVVRDITTKPYKLFAPVAVSFDLLPWVTAPLAAGAVNPTSHALVALFSGPPCTVGHQMLVRFQPAAPTASQNPNSMTTNLVACSESSANFYIAGMYPSTKYLMHWEEYAGPSLAKSGSNLTFTTKAISSTFPTFSYTVNVPAKPYDASYPVVLFQTAYPAATDLAGNVIWYFNNSIGLGLASLAMARIEPNGSFYSIPSDAIVQYDLVGNVVKQSNLEIMNEQLIAQGYPKMSMFNAHEVRNLPDGNIVLLGSRTVASTSAQGGTPAKPVNIQGDMVLVVDHNLQLVWAWDSFAHEDINRLATDYDMTPAGANDWLHTNAAQGTDDGNIIISQRAQDWVIKINYAKGKGDGSVIWHLGAGGDFTITNPSGGSCSIAKIPGDPNVIPWFTHQHDAHFDFEDDASGDGFMIMTIFDDGDTRHDQCPGAQDSRGMVLLVDEGARTIYTETLADLGGYSSALGSAQLLTPEDGNIYSSFDNGFQVAGTEGQVSEVNLAGQIVYQLQTNQATYRSYRMLNLYTPTEFETLAPAGIEGALPPGQPFDYSAGFAQDPAAFMFNGKASASGSLLELTDGGSDEASSVFYGSPVSVGAFTTEFTFQLTNPVADGFTFTIQNAGPNALGFGGGALGYQNIGESVAIKFDLYNNSGEGPDSTGIYTDGAAPGMPSVNLTGTGIDLHSGHPIDARMTYDGTTLHLRLVDTVTGASWAHPFTIDIPGTVGGSTAYVGFTAGTGTSSAIQQILSWSYEPVAVPYEPAGFASGAGLATNGSASLSGSSIELTGGSTPDQAGSAFFTSPVNIQSFNTDFDFQLTSAKADGFTFTMQNAGVAALGKSGGYLGYAGIGKSVAVKFDLYNDAGEGADSTGIFTDGALPTLPSIDLTKTGINLHSGDMMHAHMSYDGNALTLTLTDLVTKATFTQPFAIDIPTIVGGNTAYVGFTAGTGSDTAVQEILNWTFE